jgi:putative ABC transport system permease protein
MKSWAFAWKSLLRQPGRSILGVLGVAAVGALLFDMLLLSRGLVISFRELLGSAGFDVRVVSTELPFNAPPIEHADAAVAAIAALPSVEEVVPLRFGGASTTAADGRVLELDFSGVDPGARRPWRVLEGADLTAPGDEPGVVVNRTLARALSLAPGSPLLLRATCTRDGLAPPRASFRVRGIVDFPFDSARAPAAAARMADFRRACGVAADQADILLVASREGHSPEAAVAAIRRALPDLHPFTNEELLSRFQQVGFSYFRQISSVLSAVTLFFGFLLIAVLLTVSVNQRFAEIAALRAIGLTRRRVVMDVLCQSALLVGSGGVLSLPLGLGLSLWLDRILRHMPGIPASVNFFAFEPRALFVHLTLLALTAVLAALYPMRLVARLPIAATLRSEAVT